MLKTLKFVFEKELRQKSFYLIFISILLFLPGDLGNLFAVLFASTLFTKELENKNFSLMSTLPVSRADLYLSYYIFGASFLLFSKSIYYGITNNSDFYGLFSSLLFFAFFYSLSILSSIKGLGGIYIPIFVWLIDLFLKSNNLIKDYSLVIQKNVFINILSTFLFFSTMIIFHFSDSSNYTKNKNKLFTIISLVFILIIISWIIIKSLR
ncbi:hypothetical protein X275_01755 [Marinitoga sp. 1197]|uniref:hypothetical protein n=1 Tax=unclassified Marinitoga TaxID=2640159 RepID=UPI000641811E|nr:MULTISPECIES: hypothetical protein [unclassified Marinitoga]KLO22261.1 hypothetical protein X274_08780 [Marinitoga sp. 1155]KLO23820.1 hypothetical protein X275_01755 [Marinitoga sp. 1197]NUU99901.1 hypothetical protein [Marinitoga sp. 1154]